MNRPRVAILMAVHNGQHWLPRVLASVSAQTRPPDEVIVMDNASTDSTLALLDGYPFIRVVPSAENVGFWEAVERLLPMTTADIVIALTDVVLDERFIIKALEVFDADETVGALQAKVYRMETTGSSVRRTNIIDALGFRIDSSRRVTILGHGDEDRGQYGATMEILGVEGAVPVFRRTALESVRVNGRLIDPEYRVGALGYGDDLDLAWRMTLFGWRQVMVPSVVAWHDRSTTTGVARGFSDTLSRRPLRAAIPLLKRRLDWSNTRFTIIKNDRMMGVLRNLHRIMWRELSVQGYFLLFETAVIREWGRFIRLLPRMLARRRQVQRRAARTTAQMRAYFS
jgi:hypothetical protein